MSSTFGTLFRITTFGESHCRGVGVVVDGCPPRLELSEEDIQCQLDRRRPGQSRLTTDRDETDRVSILSGTENGRTLGTPIGLLVAQRREHPLQPGHRRHAALSDQLLTRLSASLAVRPKPSASTSSHNCVSKRNGAPPTPTRIRQPPCLSRPTTSRIFSAELSISVEISRISTRSAQQCSTSSSTSVRP